MKIDQDYAKLMHKLGRSVRAGQLDLINHGAFAKPGDSILVKAPTATGKSLAALLTGAFRAAYGDRTVISTYTKLLQNQYRRDLEPLLPLFPDVNFALLKGAANYYCDIKAERSLNGGEISFPDMREKVKAARAAFANGTLEINGPAMAMVRRWITPDEAEDCLDHKPEECGFAAAKATAREADVVITNHSLVLVNAVNPQVLGAHDLLIVDEIHNFTRAAESWDTQYISLDRVAAALVKAQYGQYIASSVEPMRKILTPGKEDRMVTKNELMGVIAAFKSLPPLIMPMGMKVKDWNKLVKPVFDLRAWIGYAVQTHKNGLSTVDKMSTVEKRIGRNGGGRLAIATIDLSAITAPALRTDYSVPVWDEEEGKKVWQETQRSVLMMSATTGTPTLPTYVADRCGVQADFREVESVLDYAGQMRVSVIKSDKPWDEKVYGLVSETGGRSLILMRSWRRVIEMEQYLKANLVHPVYVQSKESPQLNGSLVEQFAKDEKSVLIGTASFFEGIDVPGASLSQVIIGELPMPLNFSPVSNERRNRMGRKYMEREQIPHTALVLEQMMGRLIRSTTDKGVVVVLDDAASASAWARTAVDQALGSFGIKTPVARTAALRWWKTPA